MIYFFVNYRHDSSYSDMFDGGERFGIRCDHGKCRHGSARGQHPRAGAYSHGGDTRQRASIQSR